MTDRELIAELCVRIGMVMEEVSAEAVTADANDWPRLQLLAQNLQHGSTRIAALASAVAALIEH